MPLRALALTSAMSLDCEIGGREVPIDTPQALSYIPRSSRGPISFSLCGLGKFFSFGLSFPICMEELAGSPVFLAHQA